MVDLSDAGYKRSLEYLFMGEHPALPGDIDRVIEHGFRAPAALAAMVRLERGGQRPGRRGMYNEGCIVRVQLSQLSNMRDIAWATSLTPSYISDTIPKGLDGAVVLSNSVGLADGLRLQSSLELRSLAAAAASSGSRGGGAGGAMAAGGGGAAGGNLAVGRIMVVKAYLGQTASELTSIGSR